MKCRHKMFLKTIYMKIHLKNKITCLLSVVREYIVLNAFCNIVPYNALHVPDNIDISPWTFRIWCSIKGENVMNNMPERMALCRILKPQIALLVNFRTKVSFMHLLCRESKNECVSGGIDWNCVPVYIS